MPVFSRGDTTSFYQNFIKYHLKIFTIVILLLTSLFTYTIGYSQCNNCQPTIQVTLPNGGTSQNRIEYIDGSRNNQLINPIFGFSGSGNYIWSINSELTLRGIVLNSGVNMFLGSKNSNGNTEKISINGISSTNRGCIIVKSGATLEFGWITEFRNVDICVESGGTIKFDSDGQGGVGGNSRNQFTFNNVTITLQDGNSILDFGNSNLNVTDVDIIGWTGDVSCPTSTSPNPSSGQSGNIKWNEYTVNICAILNLKVLPIEWAYLNAKLNSLDRTVNVIWGTFTEKDNSHFIVERSINGVSKFENIGSVNASFYSDVPLDYSFTDNTLPSVGGNIYYRIKQYDYDGTFTYSSVVLVKLDSLNTSNRWIVYPNPVVDKINIELTDINTYNGGEVEFNIYSNGITLKRSKIGFIDLNTQLNHMIGELRKGIFVVEIIYNGNVDRIKLIKN